MVDRRTTNIGDADGSGPPEQPCNDCGGRMQLAFRGHNPFKARESEIEEWYCPGCGARLTLKSATRKETVE